MPPIITLTTDFGLRDSYVGIMKGVILSINPAAIIVDISHEVPPQDVVEGAYIVSSAYRYFPASTVHVVVVDPGVGTERSALLIETDRGTFIGPDNGVLSWATGFQQGSLKLGLPGATTRRMVKLSEPRYWLSVVSSTFHGRDIFAPVAAHLSLGVPSARFGAEINACYQLPFVEAELRADGMIVGSVIHVDRFGNLVTNIDAERLASQSGTVVIRVAGRRIVGISRTFDDSGLLALKGSMGLLEVAVGNGNAASYLGAGRGTTVTVAVC